MKKYNYVKTIVLTMLCCVFISCKKKEKEAIYFDSSQEVAEWYRNDYDELFLYTDGSFQRLKIEHNVVEYKGKYTYQKEVLVMIDKKRDTTFYFHKKTNPSKSYLLPIYSNQSRTKDDTLFLR